eukprot:scaffold179942_cov18-Tisochrysis_lutea.AAC.1
MIPAFFKLESQHYSAVLESHNPKNKYSGSGSQSLHYLATILHFQAAPPMLSDAEKEKAAAKLGLEVAQLASQWIVSCKCAGSGLLAATSLAPKHRPSQHQLFAHTLIALDSLVCRQGKCVGKASVQARLSSGASVKGDEDDSYYCPTCLEPYAEARAGVALLPGEKQDQSLH